MGRPRRALSTTAAVWLAQALGCTAPTMLPQVDGGERVPEHAAKVHFAELAGGLHVAVLGPDDDRSRARMALEMPYGYLEVFEFITTELRAMERGDGQAHELPVVIFSDGAAPASRALDWLAASRELAVDDLSVRAYIGLGDVTNPRVVEAPRKLREREDVPLFTLVLGSSRSSEPAAVCIPAFAHDLGTMGRCATLIDEQRQAAAMPPGWPADPEVDLVPAPVVSRVVTQLCDALGEPFDISWNGDSLEELARLLVDDPRAPACRGHTWLGRPHAATVETLRPHEVPGWDEAIVRRRFDISGTLLETTPRGAGRASESS